MDTPIHTPNLHGATNSHSFWTPLIHYPSPRGPTNTLLWTPLFPLPNTIKYPSPRGPKLHSFGHPLFILPIYTGPQIHTLLDTPNPIPISMGAPKYTPLHTPYSYYQSTRGHTFTHSGHPLIILPIYTEAHIHPSCTQPHIHPFCTTQLWSLYHFRLFV